MIRLRDLKLRCAFFATIKKELTNHA